MNNKAPEMLTLQITEMMEFVAKHYFITKNKLAQQHIIAIGRRYSMMADAYVEIAQLFNREPDSEIEQRYFNIYLNSLYINIFGCIENLAWLLYFQIIYPMDKMGKFTITLFHEKLLSNCLKNGIYLSETKTEYVNWIKDLKTKRDPIAHQIPLYIPYRIITNEKQKSDYKEMEKEALSKANCGDTHGYIEIMSEARKIGEYIPRIWLVDSVKEDITFVPFKEIVNEDMIKLNGLVENIIGKIFK